MQWELLGFKDDPFKTHPITAYTVALYTGNGEKIKQAKFALNTSNIVIVVEGERGVGTTSFGNFLRFSVQKEKKYFTPASEIKVEPYWNADTLMAAVIGNVVTSLELEHHDEIDRKSTRLNSSHSSISYAVFFFKKNINTHIALSPSEWLLLTLYNFLRLFS